LGFGKIRQEESVFEAVIVEQPDDESSMNVEPWFVDDDEGVEVLMQIEAVSEEPVGLIISSYAELETACEVPPKPGRCR